MSSALYNCRKILYTNCHRFNVSVFSKNNVHGFIKFQEFQSNLISPSQTSAIRRCLSTQPNADYDNKPAYIPLMKYPEVIWPGIFQMLKCWLIFKLGFPSLDRDFEMLEFIRGSQQAAHVVSSALSKEDYESLDGLVTPEAIAVLKQNISKMSDQQKREIYLQKQEFFFCFPWEINVRNGTEKSSKIVEIVMVFHVLRNWKGIHSPSQVIESNAGMQRLEIINNTVGSPDYQSHAIIGNYRFIRDFGSDDKTWLINLVNQFKISDVQ